MKLQKHRWILAIIGVIAVLTFMSYFKSRPGKVIVKGPDMDVSEMLHMAVIKCDKSSVEFFLGLGAKPHIKAPMLDLSKGRVAELTALELAKSMKSCGDKEAIIGLLKKYDSRWWMFWK